MTMRDRCHTTTPSPKDQMDQVTLRARGRRGRKSRGHTARRSLGRTLALSILATTATSGLVATAAGATSPAPRVHRASAHPAILTDATAAATTYTVQPGDTLSAIAAQYGSSVAAIAAANGIADPNLIFAGQVLTIPSSTSAVTTASVVTSVPAAAPAAPAATAPAPATTSTTTSATLFSTLTLSAQGTFECIVQAESSGNPQAYNASSGAMGLLQFMESTWLEYGGGAYGSTPRQATPREQMNIGVRAYQADGFAPWAGDGCV